MSQVYGINDINDIINYFIISSLHQFISLYVSVSVAILKGLLIRAMYHEMTLPNSEYGVKIGQKEKKTNRNTMICSKRN